MLGRLSVIFNRHLTVIPRRTRVTRPDFPRYDVGPVHVRPSNKEVKIWELSAAFVVFATTMFAPGLYMASTWKNYKAVEE